MIAFGFFVGGIAVGWVIGYAQRLDREDTRRAGVRR